MRYAFCLFRYVPLGGLQLDCIEIAKECQSQGHQVDFYTITWAGPQLPGSQVFCLPAKGITNHAKAKSFADLLQKELKSGCYDLVVGFNKMPGLDVCYAGDKCYVAEVKEQRSWVNRLFPRYHVYAALEEAVFSPTKKVKILLLNQQEKPIFQHYYHTQDERFIPLLPAIGKQYAINFDYAAKRNSKRIELDLQENNFLLLFVGSSFKRKGLDRCIDALSRLPKQLQTQVHLVVIGDDQSEPFKKLADRHDVTPMITFLGGCNDVPDWMMAADFLLHPAYSESAGKVIIESLMMKLPVLVTDNCGYAHYIQESGAGVVLSASTTGKNMAAVLADILSRNRINSYHEKACQYIKKNRNKFFGMAEQVAKYLEALANRNNKIG